MRQQLASSKAYGPITTTGATVNLKSRHSLLLAVIAETIILGTLHANQPPKNAKSRGCGPPTEGFQLCLKLDERQVRIGEPVLLRVFIKNVTTKELLLGEFTPETENRVTMTKERGVAVQATKKGKLLMNRAELFVHPLTITMGPGQVHIETLALDKLFEISTSAKYFITVTRVVGKQDRSGVVKVTSNTVSLTVL